MYKIVTHSCNAFCCNFGVNMKYTVIAGFLLLAGATVLSGCHSGEVHDSVEAGDTTMPKPDSAKTFAVALLDNKKDPVCGMPIAGGMQDTIHLNGKVIGFCSDECKNNFLKNPKQYAVEYK
jgi:YHS domain-containing protein